MMESIFIDQFLEKFESSVYKADMSTLRSFVEKRYEVRNVRDGLQDDCFLIVKGKEQDEFVFYYINGVDEFKGECFYWSQTIVKTMHFSAFSFQLLKTFHNIGCCYL